jgi:FG-GAP-like repeat
LFKNIYRRDGKFPYFREIAGPWIKDSFQSSCAVAADFDRDGRDDLVVCSLDGPPLLVQQLGNDVFREINIPNNDYMQYWRNVRIANVVGDSLADLVVVTWAVKNIKKPPYLYIFRGIAQYPYFDFTRVYFQMAMKYATPDVEVLDVNMDNVPDIYVVQVDEVNGYCAKGEDANKYWGGGTTPTEWWIPPVDNARDILLVGTKRKSRPFTQITLQHAQPGCGYIAQRWGDQTMLLGQGSFDAAGNSLLLNWG